VNRRKNGAYNASRGREWNESNPQRDERSYDTDSDGAMNPFALITHI
jgi:hypothetical protein